MFQGLIGRAVWRLLAEDDRDEAYRFDVLQRGLKPQFDWKDRVNETHGLAFALDYTALYQGANERAGMNDDAAGGIFRFSRFCTVVNCCVDAP